MTAVERMEAGTYEGARVKVLMIAGWGRSGSTILSDLLGEADGVFSAGELHYLWLRGLIRRRLCGCREPVPDCSLWSTVIGTRAFRSAMQGMGPREVVDLQAMVARERNLGRVIRAVPGRATGWEELDTYREVLAGTYSAISQVTGARVIVDSSKRPVDAAIARLIPDIDVYLLHLVRDPRGVAYSRSRQKEAFGHVMGRMGPGSSTLRWLHRNLATHSVRHRLPPGRSKLLRYEDLAREPRATLGRIVSWIGEEANRSTFIDERTARLHPSHAVSGNQSRFDHGSVVIRTDQQWIAHQGRTDRAVTTAIALPLMRRYGYPLFVHRGSDGG